MKSTLDCIPCFITHAIHVARMVTDNPEQQADIVRKTLAMVADMRLEETPPEMAKKIHAVVKDITGVIDAYQGIKDESTQFALEMLPFLRHEVKKSGSPFETIIRLIIAGNVIDFGADHNFKLDNVHEIIADSLKQPIDSEAIRLLKKAMEKAENILYIVDNCGEAVFDRLLIELYSEKITLAVRGRPILNDITRREAEMSGLVGLVRIIDTGDSTPGVVLKYCGAEFKRAFRQADLIISKGQGNYETMSETERPVFFLLKAKCPVIASKFKTEQSSMLVIPKNIS